MRINLIGQIYGCLGIPIHTRGLFDAIIQYGISHDINNDYHVYPIARSNDPYGLKDPESSIQKYIEDPSTFVNSNGLTIVFWSPDIYPIVASRVNREKTLLCGYLIFEWTKLSPEYINNCMLMDYLLVPSNWAKDILINHGIPRNKVRVVPAGLHVPFNRSWVRANRTNVRRFLMVGKWETRKHHDTIFRSLLPLLAEENMSLTCLVNDPFDPKFDFFTNVRCSIAHDVPIHALSNTEFTEAKNLAFISAPKSHTLYHLNQKIISTETQLRDLYLSHDFLIQPSRAGAVELPLLEAQACGIIPIGMKVSGMADYYATQAFLVPSTGKTRMFDDRWFKSSTDWGVWENIDVAALNRTIKSSMQIGDSDLDRLSKYITAETMNKSSYPKIVRDLLMGLRMDENANGNQKRLDILY